MHVELLPFKIRYLMDRPEREGFVNEERKQQKQDIGN